jgi:hypothetical protein
MTPAQLRKSLFNIIDKEPNAQARVQLRAQIEHNIEEEKYTEEYWLNLIDQMIVDGQLIEGVEEDGSITVKPPKESK